LSTRYNRRSLNALSSLRPPRIAGFALVCVVSAACAAPAASTNTSASGGAQVSGSASASASPAGYRVLFTASTTTGNDIFLYDSASSTPQSLVTLGVGPSPQPRFVTAQTVGYIDSTNQGTSRILKFDLSSRASSVEVSASGYIPAFAYKHDGSSLAYLEHGANNGKATLHILTGGQDTALPLNSIAGRGVSRDDEVRLQYSPDDKYLLMVDTFVGNQGQAPETGQFLVLRSADHTLAFLPPAGVSSNATMATWARGTDRLYYRDAVGVRTWDAEVTSVGTLAANLHWYDPATSADGHWITYTDFDTRSVPHVHLYDLRANQVTATASPPRSHPVFVSSDTIWFLEEQPCQGECLGGASTPSGKVFAYNLRSASESALPFTDVHDLSDLSVAPR